MTSSSGPAAKPTPRPAHRAGPSTPAGDGAKPAVATTKTTLPTATPVPSTPSHNGGEPAEPSIGQLVSDASTHLSELVHNEIELAKLELRSTVKNAGTGAGLFAAAAVVLVFSLTFGFFALAEGLAALGLDRWLAFLIVFGIQLVLVALFVFVGVKKVKRVKAPERTIRTTKETVGYLKNHSDNRS